MTYTTYYFVLIQFLSFIYASNNITENKIQERKNITSFNSRTSDLIDLSSIKFVHLKNKERYMAYGNIIIPDMEACEILATDSINCVFSPVSPSDYNYYTTIMNEKYVSCPKTHITVLSEDKDVKYFVCYASQYLQTPYYVEFKKNAEEYSGECEEDKETSILGIVFGTSAIMVISLACCCYCHIRNRDKVECNCNSNAAALESSTVQPVQGIPVVVAPPPVSDRKSVV